MQDGIKIIKVADLSQISEICGLFIQNGIIYLATESPASLLVLNQSLEIVTTTELNLNEIFLTLNSLNINNYPFLIAIPQKSGQNGHLIKLPTKFNKKHLVFTVNSFKELYRIIAYNEDVSPSEEINIKGCSILENKIMLFQDNPEFVAVLTFDKDEFIEFAQQHSEGIPFPTVSKKIKQVGEKLISVTSFEAQVFWIVEYSAKLFIKKFTSDLELIGEYVLPFEADVKLISISIYEKDINLLIALAIFIQDGKQKICMLEIPV